MSEGEASAAGRTSDPRTSGHAAPSAEGGGPTAASPARHGDNYADWIRIDERTEVLVPVTVRTGEGVWVPRATGSHVPCDEALARLATQLDEVTAKLQFVLDHTPTEDGTYTFPDGDTWDASREL